MRLFTQPDGRKMKTAALLYHLSIQLVCQIFLVTGVSCAVGQEAPTLKDGGHFDCLSIADFGLRGVRLWEPEATAKDKPGESLWITKGSGEDDGGPYSEITHHYADMEVSIVRGAVDRIYTATPGVGMSSGIKVGLAMDQVVEVLGRAPRDWQESDRKFSIVTCPEDGEWVQEDYVDMQFDETEILRSIEFFAHRP
jgi:hypothetical protein